MFSVIAKDEKKIWRICFEEERALFFIKYILRRDKKIYICGLKNVRKVNRVANTFLMNNT